MSPSGECSYRHCDGFRIHLLKAHRRFSKMNHGDNQNGRCVTASRMRCRRVTPNPIQPRRTQGSGCSRRHTGSPATESTRCPRTSRTAGRRGRGGRRQRRMKYRPQGNITCLLAVHPPSFASSPWLPRHALKVLISRHRACPDPPQLGHHFVPLTCPSGSRIGSVPFPLHVSHRVTSATA